MPGQHQSEELAFFAGFELDVRTGELSRDSQLVARLSEQPLQILIVLLRQPGELVTREDLQKKLWPDDTVVEFEHSINAAMNRLRTALVDSAKNPQFIETLARKGYRWKTSVEWSDKPGNAKAELVTTSRKGLVRWWLAAAAGLLLVLAVFFSASRNVSSKNRSIGTWRQRQLTVNSNDNPVAGGAISPDGKSLVYSDGEGIHLRPLEGGNTVPVANPDVYQQTTPFWEIGFWLPDSQHFYAIAELPRKPSELWLLSTAGGKGRKLATGANPWGVAPDGTVAITDHDDHEIWSIDSNGERRNLLLRGDQATRFRALDWSPDGQHLAYIRNVATASGNESHLEILDRKDGSTREVGSGPVMRTLSQLEQGFQDIVWLSPDRLILDAGVPDIHGVSCNFWQVRLDPKTAQLLSAPEQATNWAGFCVNDMSRTADGKKLVFARSSDEKSVFTAARDASNRTLTTPQRLTLTEDLSSALGWSDDGRSLYFLSNRLGKWGVFKQSLDSSTAATVFTTEGQIANLTLSPDKQWLLFQSRDSASRDNSPLLLRVPVSGGAEQELLSGRNSVIACSSSPQGRCLLAEVPPENDHVSFFRLDPLHGKAEKLAELQRPRAGDLLWSLSPDGTQVALFEHLSGQFEILSLRDGRMRGVTISPPAHLRSLTWSAAGDGFYVCNAVIRGAQLLFVDLAGDSHKLWELHSGQTYLRALPSSDGKSLAIDATSKNSNLWALEDF